MSSPLDNQPVVDNRPADKVFLAEAAISGWCRLHNTEQHSELNYHEFQVAADIFKNEKRNTEGPPVTGYELVPAPRYDQALVLENVKFRSQEYTSYQPNQRFPPASTNGPVKVPQYQVGSETQIPSNQSSTINGYSFPPLYNCVLVEGTREVQAFQQTSGNPLKVYQRNTRQNEP